MSDRALGGQMTLSKRWIASCDHSGCRTVLVLDPIPDGDKWDYGRAVNDADWQAASAVKETRCPEHAIDHDAFVEQIERRRAADIRKHIDQQARAMSVAIQDQENRGRR